VTGNQMRDETRLIENVMWTRGNMPAHLADRWPATWPKHDPIVVTRNVIGAPPSPQARPTRAR
jgi:hypothetical protein